MKLKPADINRIMDDNIPKPEGMRSANDFAAENEAAREALLQGLIAQNSQSTARNGTVLPPPPKSLTTEIFGSNDFGVQPTQNTTTTTTTTVEGSAQLIQETSRIPLPAALRGTDLDKILSRADLMYALTQNLPLNEIGLPKIIYRADLIDWQLFRGVPPLGEDPTNRYKTMQDFLDCATLYLSYVEGFPALPTGEPLWAKMPFETEERYASFTSYCTQPGTRQLAKIQGHTPQELTQWFHEDYWSIRVKCYDMLNTIHAAKVREHRLLAAEDDHYLQAENMLNRLKVLTSEVNWDILKEDPKAFVDVIDKVMKLQRLALGQTSQSDKRELKSESIELTMRKLAQPNLIEDKAGDGGVDVRALLANPDALSSAQELIIKMSRTISNVSSPNEGSGGGE